MAHPEFYTHRFLSWWFTDGEMYDRAQVQLWRLTHPNPMKAKLCSSAQKKFPSWVTQPNEWLYHKLLMEQCRHLDSDVKLDKMEEFINYKHASEQIHDTCGKFGVIFLEICDSSCNKL